MRTADWGVPLGVLGEQFPGFNPLEQRHLVVQGGSCSAGGGVLAHESNTTQQFRDIPANQGIEVTEFAQAYRKREYKPILVPK